MAKKGASPRTSEGTTGPQVDNPRILGLLVMSWVLALTASWRSNLAVASVVVSMVALSCSIYLTLRRIDSMGRTAEAVEREVEVLLCKELACKVLSFQRCQG